MYEEDTDETENVITIDGIQVYTKNGKRYVMHGKQLVLACINDKCPKRREGGKFGEYCHKHYNELDVHTKLKLVKESLKRKRMPKTVVKTVSKESAKNKADEDEPVTTSSNKDRTVMIDGIAVYYKGGVRYIKHAGRLVLACVIDKCPKRRERGEKGPYCTRHYNDLDEETKVKLLNESIDRKKERHENKDNPLAKEKGITEITDLPDGRQIIIKNGKKYIRNKTGNIAPGCAIDNCPKEKDRHIKNNDYCKHHHSISVEDQLE
jgi:hypothetical protein